MADSTDYVKPWKMAYAWPPRPSEWSSRGAHHITVTETAAENQQTENDDG